jgi:hypothetical protein
MAACLPEQFWVRRTWPAGPDPRDALVLVDRVVRSVLKVRGGQSGSREDARGGLAVNGSPE